MRVAALIGESGTGKSYKAIMLAKELGIEYIIDDGLLIKGTKVLAGKSAKREETIVSAVKRALFMDKDHRKEMKEAINNLKPEAILILGTSDRMVDKIVKILEIPEITRRIYIEDISDEYEIDLAKKQRNLEGKHVIPVPTFEIKKEFSGYFIDTLKVFFKRTNKEEQYFEKTVVRPTFSYLGKYTISRNVIRDLIKYAAYKVIGISKVGNINIETKEQGIIISLDVEMVYGNPIKPLVKRMQEQIIDEVEYMTSLNILSVDVSVKKMIKI